MRHSRIFISTTVFTLDDLFVTRLRRAIGPDASVRLLQSDRACAALDVVELHLVDRVRLVDAALAVGMERTAFCRFFSATVGMPFSRVVRLLRLHIAVELVASTDAALSDIAMSVGFQDMSAFSRAFRLHTGAAPRQFRAQSRVDVGEMAS
jgi:transcriptional regulator GlxA family with amidase domain